MFWLPVLGGTSIAVGRAWQQKHKAAIHSEATTRKQKDEWNDHIFLCSQSRATLCRIALPTFRGLPMLVESLCKIFTCIT